MVRLVLSSIFLFLFSFLAVAGPIAAVQGDGSAVSADVFQSLEELARIVDISYCVGSSGIYKPFKCLSRCSEFEGFELVTTWNTGPLLSDSCGYIAVSHEPFGKRVIVAFRGTYSIANTIADLSTKHAEYVPFHANGSDDSVCPEASPQINPPALLTQHTKRDTDDTACDNCTVHTGFLTSWQNTRCTIIPHVEEAMRSNPDYKLVLVGHSLGGAVATLAALELQARGWTPHITTFGEPRLGNFAFNQFINHRFGLNNATSPDDARFWRVTHIDDPVPLLPLEEWGYRMHAGEIFIAKGALPPKKSELRVCDGDQDVRCIAGNGATTGPGDAQTQMIPSRYRLWELFFAHRDYFWRLGLCVPGSDPWDWNRKYDNDDEL